MLNYLTDERLRMEGFPKEATHENVKYMYKIENKLSLDMWVEMFVMRYDLEGASDVDVEKCVDDDFLVLEVILENIESVDLKLIIQESLATWLEEHGTVEYLEQEMEKNYEVIIMQELIEQSSDYEIHQKVKEALNEEGFPDEVRPEDVDYGVYDIKLTESFESLAERHIDDIEQYGGVSQYIKDEFHQDIIDDEAYTFSVSIESDREDFL